MIHSLQTTNFKLQYDDAATPSVDGDYLLNQLAANCDLDFATLKSVFGGASPKTPITVSVIKSQAGGSNNGQDMSIGSGGEGAGGPVDRLRNTFIAELSEIFMDAQANKWNPGDSKGEALSRALGGLMYPRGQQPGFTVHQWVDNIPDPTTDPQAVLTPSGRQDWVSVTFTGNALASGDNPAKPIGCGIAFLYYLNRQLGFSWARIVSAGADTLEGVYKKLTGSSNGFAPFIAAIDGEFPPGNPPPPSGLNQTDYQGPFSDGLEQAASQITRRALLSPNNYTRTPLRTSQQISAERYLAAQHVGPGTISLRALAIAAASPLGAPQRPHDPLSTVSVRGLLNGNRHAALF